MPHLVAADAGFYSAKNEATAKTKGVKRLCIPNRSTKSPERKREQKKRWFRNGQKWRTGSEGRIISITCFLRRKVAMAGGLGLAHLIEPGKIVLKRRLYAVLGRHIQPARAAEAS